jgi:hypothetical protein
LQADILASWFVCSFSEGREGAILLAFLGVFTVVTPNTPHSVGTLVLSVSGMLKLRRNLKCFNKISDTLKIIHNVTGIIVADAVSEWRVAHLVISAVAQRLSLGRK